MAADQTIEVPDGRTVGFVDYGSANATAVVWCHGGPGSRLEPAFLQAEALGAGQRIVGIDRPGYGLSTTQPGRTIAGWIDDAVAVTESLGIDEFVTVGVSTGGAYALAAAALIPARVLGVVACCAMTDMRWSPGRATMSGPHVHAIWDARDRDAAISAAVAAFGEHGTKMLSGGMNEVLAPSDLATFQDPTWMAAAMAAFPAMFANGQAGYVDDRLADGSGWIDFDVAAIRCPVVVLHGGSDLMVDPVHARHTAEMVPGAELEVIDDLGHFSIEKMIVHAVSRLLARTPG